MRVASLTAAAWVSTPCFSLRTFSAAISAARVVVLALISRGYGPAWNDLHGSGPKQAEPPQAGAGNGRRAPERKGCALRFRYIRPSSSGEVHVRLSFIAAATGAALLVVARIAYGAPAAPTVVTGNTANTLHLSAAHPVPTTVAGQPGPIHLD